MAIAKTRLHIICGFCGNSEMLSYEIVKNLICHDVDNYEDGVVIACENCGVSNSFLYFINIFLFFYIYLIKNGVIISRKENK